LFGGERGAGGEGQGEEGEKKNNQITLHSNIVISCFVYSNICSESFKDIGIVKVWFMSCGQKPN
jgi:hypothetical protein